MATVYPLLLAGGSGTRLWPVSRKSYPKQFSKLLGENSLFQLSALRTSSEINLEFGPQITLTNSDFRFIVEEQLEQVGVLDGYILIEPEAKNTGPAILAASVFALKKDQDAIILATPSDHIIPDTDMFKKAVENGLKQVKTGKMVTFAITPTHPETGYGYMRLKKKDLNHEGCFTVDQFVEKPELALAEKMLNDRDYYWNAGIFLFKAKDMIKAFESYDPETLKHVKQSVERCQADLNFLRLESSVWQKIKGESIDYSIMEKTKDLVAVVYESKWSDLGDWNAIWNETKSGSSNTSLSGSATVIDCSNSLVRSESTNQRIVGLGLKNIIAVAMPDAVLVAHKKRAQDVKTVVEHLKATEVNQAETFPKHHRPWGWFESLAFGDGFQVKRIYVKPSGKLSLQSHKYRSEHWIVVKGTARVTIESNIKMISTGESVYIPAGTIHRMENTHETPMILIEVQTGSYLGEDDIIRYQDIYERG